MKFGIALPTPADSWKTVKRAEDAGFSTAWFYDTQLLSADIFVAMGAAAVKTDRIRLGTGVLIPSNRIAPVAANGLATLNALHKGHLMFVRPDEDSFATADLIQAMTVSGTAPELRDRMRRLKEAGYDEVVVQITPGCETMIEDWARVFETV